VTRLGTGVLMATGVAAVWLGIEVVGITLLFATWNTPTAGFTDSAWSALTGVFAAAVFAGVGFLLAAKRSGNAIGWIFLVTAVNLALGLALPRYALYAVVTHPGSKSGGVVVAALSYSGWVILITSVWLLVLFFPHGRLPSRRWRPVVALGASAPWHRGSARRPSRVRCHIRSPPSTTRWGSMHCGGSITSCSPAGR